MSHCIKAVMPNVYASIREQLVLALENVDVLNHTEIDALEVSGLTETARLLAILQRRTRRLCDNKLDHVKTIAQMHGFLVTGQRLAGQDTTDASSSHQNLLAIQRALEKYTSDVKT